MESNCFLDWSLKTPAIFCAPSLPLGEHLHGQAQKKQVHAVDQSVQIFVQLFFNIQCKEPETLIEGSGNHSCPMFL